MKLSFLMFLGGLVVLSPAANATATCQSILAVSDTFQALETASSCDVGNVLFSGFNTSLTASNLLVATNGGASTTFGSLLGFTYDYVGGTLPGGTIGWTATFDSTAGVGCPVGFTCGISGMEEQLHVIEPNPAVVSTTYSGGFVGSSQVDGLSLADETTQTTLPLIIAPISLTKLSTYNGLGGLDSFESDVIAGNIVNSAPPIPEPASMVLLGSGLIGLGFIRRRATRKN
jgi:PEP-CTERM motif